MQLNYKQESSILAGLRLLQDLIDSGELQNYRKMPQFDDVNPLSTSEIDSLCEQINCATTIQLNSD